MDVAELNAKLGINGLQQFIANMKAVDAQIDAVRKNLDALTASAEAAKKALNGIRDSAVEAAAATKE